MVCRSWKCDSSCCAGRASCTASLINPPLVRQNASCKAMPSLACGVHGRTMKRSGVLPDHGAEGCFRHQVPINEDLAGELPEGAAAALLLNLDLKLIAGLDRLAEAAGVDRHEVDELAGNIIAQRPDDQHSGRLRHGFNDKHARHDRMAWKVALEEVLIDCDILQADGAHIRNQIADPVNHQHRIAMRYHLHDLQYIEAGQLLPRGILDHVLLLSVSTASAKRCGRPEPKNLPPRLSKALSPPHPSHAGAPSLKA